MGKGSKSQRIQVWERYIKRERERVRVRDNITTHTTTKREIIIYSG